MSTNNTDILRKSTAILVGAGGGSGQQKNMAYGGYAFQADLSINFAAPSQLSVHFVSEDGEYDLDALEKRIFPGQGSVGGGKEKDASLRSDEGQKPSLSEDLAASGGVAITDVVTIGGTSLQMHPYKYTITQNSSGHFLTIDYVDESINKIDNRVVVIKGKYGGGGGFGSGGRVIAIGGPYKQPTGSNMPGKQQKGRGRMFVDEQLPEYYYTPRELFDALGVPGAPTAPLMQAEGNLRNVLEEVCSALGLLYFWDPIRGKLGVMDLTDGVTLSNIKGNITNAANQEGTISTTSSMSLEGTFSQGAAAYWGRAGVDGIERTRISLQRMNLMTVDLNACRTAAGTEVEVGDTPADKGLVYNDADYCLNAKKWLSVNMSTIKDKAKVPDKAKDIKAGDTSARFKDYVRLLKASLLGPEFFRVYILNKKAASNAAQFPDNLESYNKRVDPFATEAPVVANAVNPALSSENALVDELYVSTTPGNKVLELKGDHPAMKDKVLQKFVVGTDCVSIQALKESELQTVQLYDMAKRVADATASTIGVGKNAADSQGAVTFFRLQKYGITNLSGSGEDQIYKTVRGIAEHYGRYHYSPKTIRKGDWETMTLSTEGQGTWYNVEVDVNDTVLAALYAALDPQATVAKEPMPNDCVEGKDGASDQVNCDGKAFKKKNTANPSLQEFIQSVERNTITDKTEGEAPNFDVTVANGEVTAIKILSSGDDLADGTHDLEINGGANASGAKATITIKNGIVVEGSLSLVSGGSGYNQAKTTAAYEGKKGATLTKGVFNQTISKRDINGDPVEVSSDSITASNLGIRNKCLTDDCKGDEIDDQKGIVVMDLGPQALIPESISKRVKRHVDALAVLDSNGNINVVQYHWEAGYQIVQMATPEQLEAVEKVNEAAFLFKI